tara:strand:+ start:1306 stop:1572 length:267 start_codon:yes stop_codon:yes gene_type:complete
MHTKLSKSEFDILMKRLSHYETQEKECEEMYQVMFGMKERIASLMLEVGELRDALRLANNESADALRNLIQAGEVIKTLRIRLETLMY